MGMSSLFSSCFWKAFPDRIARRMARSSWGSDENRRRFFIALLTRSSRSTIGYAGSLGSFLACEGCICRQNALGGPQAVDGGGDDAAGEAGAFADGVEAAEAGRFAGVRVAREADGSAAAG